MSNAFTGFMVLFAVSHCLLVAIPIANTLQTSISTKSKLLWCLFILLLPLVGVAFFHFRYRSSLFQGKTYEICAAEERARSGTLAPWHPGTLAPWHLTIMINKQMASQRKQESKNGTIASIGRN